MARIRELKTLPDIPVRKQHVVSAAVLRRFALPGRGSAGLQVLPNDLLHPERRPKPKGVGGCGVIKDFVPFASGSMEQVWGLTEQQLPKAFQAVENGTIFEHPDLTIVLRDLVALHFVRCERVREFHREYFAQWASEQPARLVRERSHLLRGAGLQRFGLHLSGMGLAYVAEQAMAPMVAEFESGALLRTRLEAMYASARAFLNDWAVEILTPQEGEFLIGDAPAVSLRRDDAGTITAYGMALGDCHSVVMPIGPSHCLALGPANVMGAIPGALVGMLNRAQVQAAERWVYSRPRNTDTILKLIRQAQERPLLSQAPIVRLRNGTG